jgi:GNAT superfamily N-acetyltransferase
LLARSQSRVERVGLAAMASMYGDRVLDLDGALALRAPEAPDWPMLNRILRLGVARPATEAVLDRAMEAMAGLRYYVTLSADAHPSSLVEWLRARGFTPGWGWMQFARGVQDVPQAGTAIELVEVGRDHCAAFAQVVRVAYELPEAIAKWLQSIPLRPGWMCLLALADGEPAGAAALYVYEQAGYLGLAGTLPELRGQGAQTALLAARIRRAKELGCDIVFTETGEARPDRSSASYRNIVRAGFEELYVVPNWLSPSR